MSLKAKIEAVIYASEEPVTLQQLVGLLGQEAQTELDAADALQGQLDLLDAEPVILLEQVEAGDQDALNAETLGIEDFAAVEPPTDPAKLAPDADGQSASTSTSTPDSQPEEPAATAQYDPASQPRQTEPAQDAGVSPFDSAAEMGSATESPIREQLAEAEPAEPTPAELRARERRLREYMRSVLDALIAEYANGDRGLEIREVAGGFRFATKPEFHDAVRGFVRSLKPPLKLSLQALETLAVVAYKQPVTAPEVSEIRGVDSGGVLGSLMTRKLVTTAGRKQVIGRPILYKTTKEFLLRFGLKDVNELPSIEEFERMANDLNEAVQEEIPMADPSPETMPPAAAVGDAPRNLEPSRDVHQSQPDGFPNGPSDPDSDDELLLKPQDAPGEFTGNASVPPADNASIDGRNAGVPPNYDPSIDEMADSPAMDAAIQRDEPGSNS